MTQRYIYPLIRSTNRNTGQDYTVHIELPVAATATATAVTVAAAATTATAVVAAIRVFVAAVTIPDGFWSGRERRRSGPSRLYSLKVVSISNKSGKRHTVYLLPVVHAGVSFGSSDTAAA
jgi:hypothetical protein